MKSMTENWRATALIRVLCFCDNLCKSDFLCHRGKVLSEIQSFPITALMSKILPICSRLVLKGEFGIVELRGDDLVAKLSQKSLTVYHAGAETSEQASHAHLSRGRYLHFAHSISVRGTHFLIFLSTLEQEKNAAECKVYLKQPWEGPSRGVLLYE